MQVHKAYEVCCEHLQSSLTPAGHPACRDLAHVQSEACWQLHLGLQPMQNSDTGPTTNCLHNHAAHTPWNTAMKGGWSAFSTAPMWHSCMLDHMTAPVLLAMHLQDNFWATKMNLKVGSVLHNGAL